MIYFEYVLALPFDRERLHHLSGFDFIFRQQYYYKIRSFAKILTFTMNSNQKVTKNISTDKQLTHNENSSQNRASQPKEIVASTENVSVSHQQKDMAEQQWQHQQLPKPLQNQEQFLKIDQKFENPFLPESELAKKAESSGSKDHAITDSKDGQNIHNDSAKEQLDVSQEYSSIFAKKQDISVDISADPVSTQIAEKMVDGQSQVNDQGLKSRNNIIFKEVVLETDSDSKDKKQPTMDHSELIISQQKQNGQFGLFVDTAFKNTEDPRHNVVNPDLPQKQKIELDSLQQQIDTQMKNNHESSSSLKNLGTESPTQHVELDNDQQKASKVAEIYQVESNSIQENIDLNQMRKNHLKELKKRKRLLTKDDFGRVENRKSMEETQNDYFEKGASNTLRQSQFHKNQKGNHKDGNPARARKMSETPPKRSRQNELKTNLISNEEIDELEVNHSLQILQQAHFRNPHESSSPRKQITQDFVTSPWNRNRYQNSYLNLNLNAMSLVGGESQTRILNPKDSIFRKLSNYASNGYDGDEGQSQNDVINDNKWPDITKAQKPTQSEKDDGEDDDEQELVSLDDRSLENVKSFHLNFSNASPRGQRSNHTHTQSLQVNTMLERNLQKAIDHVENLTSHQIEAQPLLPEEFESLVFGQSIWSTEVPMESKKQFMANLQQIQSSDINQQNSSDANKDQAKENQESDHENEFEILQRKIQQETLRQTPSPDVPVQVPLTSAAAVNNDQVTQEQTQLKLPDKVDENQQLGQSQQQYTLSTQQQQTIVEQQHQRQNSGGYPPHSMSQYPNGQSHQQQTGQTSIQQYQENQQTLYPQQFSQGPPQQNQYDMTTQAATGSQPVTDMNQGQTQPQPGFQQDTADYAGQYTQQQQNFNNASVGVNDPSVHSGQVAFGAPAGTGSAVGVFELGGDYHGDQSSNYCPSTHHPFSVIGDINQNQQYMPANNHHHHFGQANQNQNGGGHGSNYYGQYGKMSSKMHIIINRQMSRHMMNPIFKNKHVPVMMHRFSGVPWRGGHNAQYPQAIITPQGYGGQSGYNNIDHGPMPYPHQQMNYNGLQQNNNANQNGNMGVQPQNLSMAQFGSSNSLLGQQHQIPLHQLTGQTSDPSQANQTPPSQQQDSSQMNFSMQALQNIKLTKDQFESGKEQLQVQQQALPDNKGSFNTQTEQSQQMGHQQTQMMGKVDRPNEDGSLMASGYQHQPQMSSKADQDGGDQMQSTLTAEPFYPIGYQNEKIPQTQFQHDQQLMGMNSMGGQGNPLAHMTQQQMQQANNQSANPQGGKKFGNLLGPAHKYKSERNLKPAIHVLPIPIMAGIKGAKPKQGHQNMMFHHQGAGEKHLHDNTKMELPDHQNGMKQTEQHYRQQQMLTNFYDSSILSKKIELDQKMKQTTEKLGQKIIKAKEINEDDDEDDQEEDDITLDILSTHDANEHISVERSDSILNKSLTIRDISQHLGKVKINLKNLKHDAQDNKEKSDQQAVSGLTKQEEKIKSFEEKVKKRNQRAAIFKKLQEQLDQFKNEMFEKQEMTTTSTSAGAAHNNSSSISPKRSQTLIKGEQDTKDLGQQNDQKMKEGNQLPSLQRLTPFRQDAKQYMDKVLDLMNMINEVDDVTNVADLKNKIERYKIVILKTRAERDYQSQLVAKLQQQIQEQSFLQTSFKEKELNYQRELNEKEHNRQLLTQQMQQVEQQLRQENHDLILQNGQLQKNLEDHAQLQQHQLQQISTLTQQNESLQSNVYSQLNQIQQLQQQIEQSNKNHYQVQQNLNQQQLDNQMIQSKLDKMESDRVVLETQLSQCQMNMLSTKNEESNAIKADNPNARKKFRKKQSKIDKDNNEKRARNDISPKKIKGQIADAQDEADSDNAYDSSQDSDEVPLEVQLQNANQQVKDLQEYIKKRRLNDHQNKQSSQEPSPNEKLYLEKFNKMKKQYEEMEREKDKIILRLKDFIKNHNESILIGSLGSSMVGTGQTIYSSNVGYDAKSERGNDGNGGGMQGQVDDASTIEARSMIDNSIDNVENEDIVRAIMNDYTCEKCEQKEKIIENNEQRINDYIAYIQKQSLQRHNRGSPQQKETSSLAIQTEFENQTSLAQLNSLSKSQPQDARDQSSSIPPTSASGSQQIKTESNVQVSAQNNSTSSSGALGSNASILKSSHQILLNNYIRQVKVYLDNVEEQESESIGKMKQVLEQVASSQRITLFDEDELPDNDLITSELIQQIIQMSLDLVNNLLVTAQKATSESLMLEQQQPQIVEKIIEKVSVQFKTIEFGLSGQELKDMQKLARDERKACHHIIVEIEKLMYEMNTFMSQPQDQLNHAEAAKVFTKILDTYLSLPHRLKPIFDHCKKIESVMQKAMKSQEEVLKKAQLQSQSNNNQIGGIDEIAQENTIIEVGVKKI